MITTELLTEILTLAALVLPITQAVKKWLNVDGYLAVIVSAMVSILLCLWRILSEEPYDWSRFIILVIGVFLESNGIYHFGSHAVGKVVANRIAKG